MSSIWYKLCEVEVSLKFVTSIKAIYNTVNVCVKSFGKLSLWFDSLVGVKRWETLSPLLFILFLDELTHELDIEGNNDVI